MVVAIDGPAGSGKSSIAKMVADSLGFTYVNSGSIYRAMTLRGLRSGTGFRDPRAMIACAREARIEYVGGRLHLDGTDVELELRSAEVDACVAQVSAIAALRDIVNEHVRRMAGQGDVVVEGRDMSTVVFPDADLKIYLDAAPEARARRRMAQAVSGEDYETVLRNIRMRDDIDIRKSVGSLKIDPEAYYLDSSGLTIGEVYAKVYGKILQLRDSYGHEGSGNGSRRTLPGRFPDTIAGAVPQEP